MDDAPKAREPAFLTLQGRGTAPGIACGPLRRNHDSLSPDEARDTILVARRAVPEDAGRILAAAGTLNLGGAVLSHVSLLSREFGKPSITLASGSRVRLIEEPGDALLELLDIVGANGRPVLNDGDVVLLDGDRGTVQVPGGLDPEARRRVRQVLDPLRRYRDRPGDAGLVEEIVEAAGDMESETFAFLLEAGLIHRLAASGEPTRRLLDALRHRHDSRLGERLRALAARVTGLSELAALQALESLDSAEDLDELGRVIRGFERVLDRDVALLQDLGAPTGPLEQQQARVAERADGRRGTLASALRTEITASLELPDDSLRHKVGMLYQLRRRAWASGLEAALVDALQERLTRLVAREKARAGAHLVVPLDADSPRERSLVGGKAAGLFGIMEILPAGCRIPRGFVVTTSAYRLHLLGETGEKLRRALEQEADEAGVSRRARAALLSGEIPAEVAQAVLQQLDVLGPGVRLAVRSSSTIEDGPVGTLAGQFDSYLGVHGEDELLNRIRWAWASLWNSHALRTLAAAGLSPRGASQAVLVQEMVETRSAGVLFSRDPAGKPDTVLVNATWGLGEGVSQGEVAGDLYWVRRSTGEVLAREVGSGARQIVLDPERTGTLEVDLPAERAGVPCLGDGELSRLAGLARALEEATGRGQDVEFGFAEDGTPLVFQVRRVVPRRTD